MLSECIIKVGSKYQNGHILAFKNQLQTKSKLHITLSQRLNYFVHLDLADPVLVIESSKPGEFCLWQILKSETSRDITNNFGSGTFDNNINKWLKVGGHE